jgi:hypothetical protein
MAKPREISSGWLTYEIFQRDSEGNHAITPFSDALAGSGGRLAAQAVDKMRIVQDLGWPNAKRLLKDDLGRPLIVKKDEIIWLLKCKPTCWRLYFYVWQNHETKRIIYVHAICKKANKEDPNEATRARSIFDGIRPGGSAITQFEFPTD